MGKYVEAPPQEPFEWVGDERFPAGVGTGAYNIVTDKFEKAMDLADTMLTQLIGTDGTSGYLGALNGIIEEFQAPNIVPTTISIPDLSVPSDTRPPVDISGINTNFTLFDTPPPSLLSIPTVDLSSLQPLELPNEITVAISWLESPHDITLFTPLLTRIINDLQTGATGLDVTVEQEIFDRARARQTIEFNKTQTEIEDYFAVRGFDLPPGAMAGRLQEQVSEQARNLLDLNGKIMIEQAELAQKNSQFILGLAKDLEAVLRDFTNKNNDRALDYAKAVATNTITIYSEAIKAYIASSEANKMYVEVQVENLKAIVESNKGLVASFAAEADAYNAIVTAQAKGNEAVIGAIDAEIRGYEAETKAISANQDTQIKAWQLKVQVAETELKAAIANAENILRGYESESRLREQVATAMANISMQSLASALNSVNASAQLSNSASEQVSESFGHSEQRSVSWDHNGNISESHPFEDEAV